MKIRIMTISDYSNVYKLWLSCKGMGLNNLDDSKDGIEKFLNRNPDTCFVAETDNKIIGAILTGNDGRRGYIYHTAVSPEYQKQGIGKQLVDTAVNALKNIGINKTALVVFDKLEKQLSDGRLMYAYFYANKIIGYYSLVLNENKCEINNLCVLPEYRHNNIGKKLLEHALEKAKEQGCSKIEISIVEENKKLKAWYKKFGFKTTYIKKYDFFPFTCGYMEKTIEL